MTPFDLAPQPTLPGPAGAYAEAALSASAKPMPGVRAVRGIAWGPEPWQRLDLFRPDDGRTGLPVLFFLHGGGWCFGYREWCGFMAPAVAAAGAILVAPSYRLAPAHRFPAGIADSADALEAAAGLVGHYGGDPGRIVASGHSAGGHLAAMVALHPDYSRTDLRGVLPVSGIMDLHYADPQPGSLEEVAYRDVLAQPADDVAASPTHWAARATIPFHLFWGELDNSRVLRTGVAMWRALEKQGRHTHRIMPGQDHFGTHMALADAGHPLYAAFIALTR